MENKYLNIDPWIEKRGLSVGRIGKHPAIKGRQHSNYSIPDAGDDVDLRPLGEARDITVRVSEVFEGALCKGVYLVVDNTNLIFGRKWKLGEEISVEFSIDRIRCVYERE